MTEHINIRDLIAAKSDQLNADDLISGPITVTLTSINVKRGDQPVTIGISGGHQPWKPCKTTLRVLVFAWGEDYPSWVGRSITLYLDPEVKWGGVKVGGIRIAAMSHIPKRIELSLAETKGKKVLHKIEVLKTAPPIAMPDSFDDHVLAFGAATHRAHFEALDAERIRQTKWLSKDEQKALKAASDACKARLDAVVATPPVTPERDPADAPQHGD